MKTILSASIMCLVLFACSKKSDHVELVPGKKMTFQIFTDTLNPPLDTDTSTITINLKAFRTGYSDPIVRLLWDTTLAPKRLTTYPDQRAPILILKDFPLIDNEKENVYSYVTVLKGGNIYKAYTTNAVPFHSSLTVQIKL